MTSDIETGPECGVECPKCGAEVPHIQADMSKICNATVREWVKCDNCGFEFDIIHCKVTPNYKK